MFINNIKTMDLFRHFHQNSCCIAAMHNKNVKGKNDVNAKGAKRKGKSIMSNLELYFNDVLELNPSFASFLGRREYDNDYENPLSSEYKKKMKKIICKYKNVPVKTLDDEILRYIIDEKNRKKKSKKPCVVATTLLIPK